VTVSLFRWVLVLPVILLTACLDVTVTQVQPSPNVVAPPTVTQAANIFPTVTPSPTTALSPSPPAATQPPTQASSRLPQDVSLLWQNAAVTNPIAIGGVIERLGVLTADGEFMWLDGRTGEVVRRTTLWADPAPNATTGDMLVEGSLAIITLRERTTDPDTGLTTQRAKLVVLDGDATVVWELDELTDGRYYTVSISSGTLLIGTAPRGFDDNDIGGYELFTGGRLWRTDDTNLIAPTSEATPTPNPQPVTGYTQIKTAGGLAFALLDNGTGGGLMAFSPNNGDVLWVRQNRSDAPLRRFAIQNLRLYALSEQSILVLDGETGDILLRSAFPPDVQAGIAPFAVVAAVAPAPTATLTRPGIIGFDGSGDIRWHSVIGLRAQSLAAGQDVVWAVLTDFDEGVVALSLLNAADGLELRRIRISENVDAAYEVHVEGRRVYVLGDVLYAFGY
jgi:outer membrane protein assembly factor BamB